MKKLLLASGVIAIFVFITMTGCEEDGANSGDVFRIEPSEVTLSSDEGSTSLHVVGGTPPYTWSVSDTTLGTVASNGEAVTYIRTKMTGVNVVSVRDSKGWSASAHIYQTDKPSEPSITPATATLENDGDKIVFTGSGGTGPYRWSVADETRGKVSYKAWSQALYTRLKAGNNSVILTDSEGHRAVAQIIQPEKAVLAISPASASVSTNGGIIVFTAVGGKEPYTWSFSVNNSGATLTPLPLTSGSSKVYTCPPCNKSDTDVISLKDANGTEVFAIVTKY